MDETLAIVVKHPKLYVSRQPPRINFLSLIALFLSFTLSANLPKSAPAAAATATTASGREQQRQQRHDHARRRHRRKQQPTTTAAATTTTYQCRASTDRLAPTPEQSVHRTTAATR